MHPQCLFLTILSKSLQPSRPSQVFNSLTDFAAGHGRRMPSTMWKCDDAAVFGTSMVFSNPSMSNFSPPVRGSRACRHRVSGCGLTSALDGGRRLGPLNTKKSHLTRQIFPSRPNSPTIRFVRLSPCGPLPNLPETTSCPASLADRFAETLDVRSGLVRAASHVIISFVLLVVLP